MDIREFDVSLPSPAGSPSRSRRLAAVAPAESPGGVPCLGECLVGSGVVESKGSSCGNLQETTSWMDSLRVIPSFPTVIPLRKSGHGPNLEQCGAPKITDWRIRSLTCHVATPKRYSELEQIASENCSSYRQIIGWRIPHCI